jgi:hypothetical protein
MSVVASTFRRDAIASGLTELFQAIHSSPCHWRGRNEF